MRVCLLKLNHSMKNKGDRMSKKEELLLILIITILQLITKLMK